MFYGPCFPKIFLSFFLSFVILLFSELGGWSKEEFGFEIGIFLEICLRISSTGL